MTPIPTWNEIINDKEEAASAKIKKIEFKRFSILLPTLFEVICYEGCERLPLIVRYFILARDHKRIKIFLTEIIEAILVLSIIKDNNLLKAQLRMH